MTHSTKLALARFDLSRGTLGYPPIAMVISPTAGEPNGLEESGPDHEARHDLHGEPRLRR